MSKIAYSLLMVLLLEAGLYFFGGTTYTNTSLFDLLLNPVEFFSNYWYIAVLAALGVFAAATVIPGSFYQINIFAMYAGLSAMFMTFSVSIINLWRFLNGSLAALDPVLSQLILFMVISPILIFYIISVVEWVRA